MSAVHRESSAQDARHRRLISPDDRWVILPLQLPARPSNARVKTWRRLQQLGAIPVKHAVYVLPQSTQSLEDFSWLRTEIESVGGQATVFTASTIDDLDEAEIVEQFRVARAADFKQLLADILLFERHARSARSPARAKELRGFRERLDHTKSIDFFSAPGSIDAETALTALERQLRRPVPAPAFAAVEEQIDPASYLGRTWLTRPRPGVDRFASAWLIRRFIDSQARFAFGTDPAAMPDAVPFDMYDAVFRHEGARCTFEVLALRFGVHDLTVRRIGEIVHDVDLKDERFRARHAPTIAMLVEGLRASFAIDSELLQAGMSLFEALYQGLQPAKIVNRRLKRHARR